MYQKKIKINSKDNRTITKMLFWYLIKYFLCPQTLLWCHSVDLEYALVHW